MTRGLTGRMVVASGLLAIIVGGAFAAVLLTITQLRGTTDLRIQTREALVAADALEKHIIDLETGLRGFVITRDESFLQPSNDARAALPGSARALERLAADEPVQLARVRRIVGAMDAYLQQYSLPLVDAVRRNDPSVRSVARTVTAKQRVDALREGLTSFRKAERTRLSARDTDVDQAARRATTAGAVGVAGSILLILVFASYLTRVIVRPLRRAALMAHRLAGGDLSARMHENDVAEIGALERSFNAMAGSLENSRDELASLADEQAALRRVATLVARGMSQDELFAAVNEEVGRLVGADPTSLMRFEADDTVTLVAAWSAADADFPIGARRRVDHELRSLRDDGRALRFGPMDTEFSPDGPLVEEVSQLGIRSAVGVPIVVDGRVWGAAFAASTREQPIPAGTETRLAQFTDLLATAIANAESRAGLARLAAEQAALRRVATLVAHGAAPDELFAAVTEEVAQLLGADIAGMTRYEPDGSITVVAASGWAREHLRIPVGQRWTLGGNNINTLVFETGRPARLDAYMGPSGPLGDAAREYGVASAVGTPIVVDGNLWGVMGTYSTEGRPLPPDTESRLENFTEIVGTAIANADARTEVAASRARIVAATDDERRRVVRDLHDGAQQRVVHTIVTLKMACGALDQEQDAVPALLDEALHNAELANVELRELAHGILPPVLTRGGLRAGVAALASRTPVPVEIDVSVGRLPIAIEATAYFVIAEALTNIAKHARAGHAEVVAQIAHGTLEVQVRDDGVGGARPDGSGLLGLADRVAALDGRLRVVSPAAGGTLVTAAIPMTSATATPDQTDDAPRGA